MTISALARQCGIAPVTLRAWERRYGLIQPVRSAKGHRLYPREQIERVQQIMLWINRGVPVGQVRELLERDAPQWSEDSRWRAQRLQLLEAVQTQNERRLDDAFNQALSLYPAHTLCAQLLLPLLEELTPSRSGRQLEAVFFHTWLRSKLGLRVYQLNLPLKEAPVLLVNMGDAVLEPQLWLLAWLLAQRGQRVEVLDWPLPAPELLQWQEQRGAHAMVLYASGKLTNPLALEQLDDLRQRCQASVLLAGPCCSIYAEQLPPEEHLSDPLQAFSALQQLGLSALNDKEIAL